MKKIFLIGVLFSGLYACNAGDDSTSNVQNFSGTVGSGSNVSVITNGTATGCQTISATGTCTVTFTYTATGTYAGPIGLTPATGYTTDLTTNPCNNASTSSNTCTITLTNNNTTAATQLTITSNGLNTAGTFTFAGSN